MIFCFLLLFSFELHFVSFCSFFMNSQSHSMKFYLCITKTTCIIIKLRGNSYEVWRMVSFGFCCLFWILFYYIQNSKVMTHRMVPLIGLSLGTLLMQESPNNDWLHLDRGTNQRLIVLMFPDYWNGNVFNVHQSWFRQLWCYVSVSIKFLVLSILFES